MERPPPTLPSHEHEETRRQAEVVGEVLQTVIELAANGVSVVGQIVSTISEP